MPRLTKLERGLQQRLRRHLLMTRPAGPPRGVNIGTIEADDEWFEVAATVDGESVDVSFGISSNGAVTYDEWWCERCDDSSYVYRFEPCSHCRRAVVAFAFWDSGDAIDDWLERYSGEIGSKGATGNSYRWPYIEFQLRNDALYVAARRVDEQYEEGQLVRITRKSAIGPSQLLGETKRKPNGELKENLERIGHALGDIPPPSHKDDDFRRVPDSMIGFMLSAAAKYDNSILLGETGFCYVKHAEAIEARFNWTVDEAQCRTALEGVEVGRTFWKSLPPVHLGDNGNFRYVVIPSGTSINEMQMLDEMPAIAVEDAGNTYDRILKQLPDFPLAHPTADDAIVDLDAKRLTFVMRFPKNAGYAGQLLFRYYRGVELDDHGPNVSIRKKHGKTYRIARNTGVEEQAIRLLRSLGLQPCVDGDDTLFGSPSQANATGTEAINPDPAFWADFFEHIAPRLVEKGWRIFPPKNSVEIVECDEMDASFGDGDDEGTFRLSLAVDIDGERISILPLVLNLLNLYGYESMERAFEGEREHSHLAVSDKRVLRMPTERLRAIVSMVKNSIDILTTDGDAIDLPMNRATEISLLDSRWGDGIQWSGGGRLKSLIEVFNGFQEPPGVEVPSIIQSTLENYQHDGVSHADFLAKNGLSMLLCDDMGLGKTLQMLTTYAAAKADDPSIGPALVLAPTTALMQWEAEVEKHCRGMKVAQTGLVNGKDVGKSERPGYYRRCKEGELDILVSTYKKAHLDLDYVSEVPWYMVVADEAQAIKAPQGELRKSVRAIPASFKYPVTGTPIENNLMELWSLFDVAIPGYLGGRTWFKKNFADPIELEQDLDALKRLKALISPVLRRKRVTDDDVGIEIPEPVIELIEVPIEGLQRDLYESVRVVQEKEVKELLKKQGLKQATGQVLMAISGMRQIVCDPRTYTQQDHDVLQSAKLDRLGRLLESFKEEGKPALVFSNFKRMMPLFSKKADVLDMPHGIVSGSVTQKNRKAEIEAFRRGDTQVLFATLGSMNASIDLYEAKATVLYEPWWNPQKENQGIGRMVRRGQEHHTTVYRMVSPNTVEMQLMKIQDRKLALVDAVFNEDLVALTRCLTEEDVAELFR